MALSDIRGLPVYFEGVGNVYPILMEDYDEFHEVCSPLYISKGFFNEVDIPLLSLVFISYPEIETTELIDKFCRLFSLVLRKEVTTRINPEDSALIGFCAESCFISNHNYEELRLLIMKQNLLKERKIYKNKLVAEWAELARKAKERNQPKISIEDIVTTVKVSQGLTYEQIFSSTIYQLYSEFYRIRKIKDFDKSVLYSTVSTEKVNIPDFAEELESLYGEDEDLFVNSDKLSKFNG
jgi:hypothetical protein